MTWLAVAIGVGIAVLFLSLVFLILRLFPRHTPRSTVPGMAQPLDESGNLKDVAEAGSLHDFLMGLHREFGPIASFWWEKEYTVSIASPELFKQHLQPFDRPVKQFRLLEPLVTRHSMQYANGVDGRSRRQAYDKVFSYESLGIYYGMLQNIADEIAGKWQNAESDDQFPLKEHMFLFASKAVVASLLGDMSAEGKGAAAFGGSYNGAWRELEEHMWNPTLLKEDSERAQEFKKALGNMKDVVARAVKERENHGKESRDFLFIDAVIGHHSDEDRRFADAVTYVVGGFHTTGLVLTWCLYFLCMHEEYQERVYQEVMDVLGPDEPVTHQTCGKLKYLRQVVDETMRCAVVAPWAARYSEEDMELGGHKIYAGTPVIHALGVVLVDETLWPAPTVFDPDRFSEKRSKGRPALAFSPFGFAGHRQCPAYRLAYVETTIMLVTALRQYRFMLVPGQEVKPQHGLVTHPKEEIWFKVARRARTE